MKDITVDSIIDILNSIIEDEEEITYNQINDDLTLLNIDSITFIRLIVIIEDEFNIEIPDEYLILNKMNTVNKIVNIISDIKRGIKI
ncbi:acyl carrier protein [Natronospora cellulosivora (SeqCode)]